MTDYDHLYKDEPWAKLAVKAGFRPGQTEASARHAFTYCADALEAAEAEIERLREALAPLAAVADSYLRSHDAPVDFMPATVPLRLLRNARAALTSPAVSTSPKE